jgi:hypothetical protein
MDNLDPKVAVGLCCTVTTLIVAVAIIAFGAGTVEPIAYGLKYNSLSKNIDSDTVYDGGWYLMFPTNSFIQYPATQVNIDFADYPNAKAKPQLARASAV